MSDLWPDSIVLDGQPIALADVLADVTIHAGRSDVSDEPTASTCQLTIHGVDGTFTRAFRTGSSLAVTVTDGTSSRPRFTGRITDARLDVDELTAIAAGPLSTLSQHTIGTTGVWPIETWSARVTRAFTEAGRQGELVLVPDTGFDPQLAARDSSTAGPTKLSDYLAFLAAMVGAAVADLPDGRMLVQAIGARTLANAIVLDPADVAYAPGWEQILPAGNIVTVRYTGDQSQSVTVQDQASIGLYGERPVTIDTAFVNQSDALNRANQRLARSAYSHWNIPEAPVLRGLDLTVGEPVELTEMPAASPFTFWTPILEGWTDELSRDEWTMRLALSDPLASGLIFPWEDVDPADLWNTINQTVAWRDAISPEALHA